MFLLDKGDDLNKLAGAKCLGQPDYRTPALLTTPGYGGQKKGSEAVIRNGFFSTFEFFVQDQRVEFKSEKFFSKC